MDNVSTVDRSDYQNVSIPSLINKRLSDQEQDFPVAKTGKYVERPLQGDPTYELESLG
ncbi:MULTISPECIES: hypothetical protein [Oscillatoriales]|uniref:Uncharacterized protein n=3 Tax=Limnospira TaxID=2596745 RepID=A0A9P1NXG3_9CYAN|nr:MULTISPECIES: hypothetical protein [Oscillatoriales]EKD11098.1 hypothetical protein SPLC1_S040950 [Arthrospira platensis C1]MBD2710143.1 hypothetical protein [Arthrospira platensis FACHB-835]MDC0838320.1 hypothetical protein [Limnoraphis robusta]MDY7055135.1 hypothetical protein [Limnospira fusiformis LS22]QJB27776.1 hypothetical protein HFV01_20820 [Limnospira fusiformis SAG 85.79]